MLLAIDAGNTTVKIGYHDGADWQSKRRVSLDDFCLDPGRYLQRIVCPAIVANVAGPRFRDALVRELASQKIFWVQATAHACDVVNLYQPPEQLGADRWAMLLAARALERQACVVVALGTALTVDVLTADGVFLGGSIAPGMQLMRTALAQGTHGVHTIPGAVTTYPKQTSDAVGTGIVYALIGVIEKMIVTHEQQTQSPVAVILTGGDAHLLLPHLNRTVQVVDNLVLEGLIVLARKENFL